MIHSFYNLNSMLVRKPQTTTAILRFEGGGIPSIAPPSCSQDIPHLIGWLPSRKFELAL